MKVDAAFADAVAGADAVTFVRALAARWPRRDRFAFAFYEPRPGLAARLPKIEPRQFFALDGDGLLALTHGDADVLVSKIVGRLIDGKEVRAQLKLQWHEAGVVAQRGVSVLVDPPPGQAIAFCSALRLAAGGHRHFPLLDFRVPAPPRDDSAANRRVLELLDKALRAIEAPPGALLRSGASFHYYGCRALSLSAWRRIYFRALLLEPLVDVRYVAHRLPSGRATLRLTSAEGKTETPQVVAVLGDKGLLFCGD